jgi:hypothetical protein
VSGAMFSVFRFPIIRQDDLLPGGLSIVSTEHSSMPLDVDEGGMCVVFGGKAVLIC